MWYLWLIFALLAVLFPVGILLMAARTAKPYRRDKQKLKLIGVNALKYCAFYWLCDLFFMAFIIDSLICKFVFGGSIMLIVFYNLSCSFTKQGMDRRNALLKWAMVQDFIVGIGLSIYLIYLVPDIDLREIISVVVAAVYGGLLTLVGVAWTIKKGESDRREDERNRVKPLWGLVDDYSQDLFPADANQKTFSKKGVESTEAVHLFNLINSDKCSFFIEKLEIEGEEYFPQTKCLIKKSEIFSVLAFVETGRHIDRGKPIKIFLTDMNFESRVYEISMQNGRESMQMKEAANE